MRVARRHLAGLILLFVACSSSTQHGSSIKPYRAAVGRIQESHPRSKVVMRLRGGVTPVPPALVVTLNVVTQFQSMLKLLVKVITAPLWFLDSVDKEAFVMSIPVGIRRALLKILFWPTLAWTLLLYNLMPDKRRWYDRVDSRIIIGALPLKRHLELLARVERVRTNPPFLRASQSVPSPA